MQPPPPRHCVCTEQVAYQKGIQCRFGARGIIAESHFDHGKNFVLMLRGRKRYLLNPPSACSKIGIIKDKTHPSFRHSEVDWSDESDWPEVYTYSVFVTRYIKVQYIYDSWTCFEISPTNFFSVRKVRAMKHAF